MEIACLIYYLTEKYYDNIIFKDKEDTLSKTYDRLIEEIQNLFIENYFRILNNFWSLISNYDFLLN